MSDISYDYMISHQYTGVDIARVQAEVSKITTRIRHMNKTYFYSNEYTELFDVRGLDYDARLAYCMHEQGKAAHMIFFILEDVESNGMKEELQRARQRGIPGTVALNKSVSNSAWVQPFKVYCMDARIHIFDNTLTDADIESIVRTHEGHI